MFVISGVACNLFNRVNNITLFLSKQEDFDIKVEIEKGNLRGCLFFNAKNKYKVRYEMCKLLTINKLRIEIKLIKSIFN
jgi:hypothetical protein